MRDAWLLASAVAIMVGLAWIVNVLSHKLTIASIRWAKDRQKQNEESDTDA
jgi:hypothetical protein